MDDYHLADLALDFGYITRDQLGEAEREVTQLSDRGVERSLIFVLGDLGYLSDDQLRELRRSTSSSQVRALVVEGFTLQGRVGSGGMGEVFRGEREDGEAAAIKILPKKMMQIDEYISRFRREARILQKLQHAHITAFYGHGVVEGRPYFIMELVEGLSLKARIEQYGALSARDTLIIMRQMAEALRFAWQFGVVHRDVKPSNIIMGAPRSGVDEPFCSQLCDFGLAKTNFSDPDDSGSLTRSGMAVGTPHYMSPEVATGTDLVAPCIDIYSLGATAYHALTGNTLYTGKSSAVIMYKQATARIDVKDLAPDRAPPGLRRLLADMLAKDRKQRIADWETVLDRIDELFESDLLDVHSFSSVSRGRAVVKPWAFMHLAVVLVTLVLLIAGLLLLLLHGSTSRVELHTTPTRFLSDLQLATTRLREGEEIALILGAGIYTGPWFFGPAHARLRIAAAGPGASVLGPEGLEQPLLYVDSGCRDLTIHGLRLDGAAGIVIQVNKEAGLLLSGVTIVNSGEEALLVDGGDVRLRGLNVLDSAAGIRLLRGSGLSMSESSLQSRGIVLDTDQSILHLDRSQLVSTLSGEATMAMRISGGTLLGSGVRVIAPEADLTCLFERVSSVEIADWSIVGGNTGLQVYNAVAPQVRRLGISAQRVGLHWAGPWDLIWRWEDQRIEAPEPLRGESIAGLPIDGPGPNPELLRQIPNGDR